MLFLGKWCVISIPIFKKRLSWGFHKRSRSFLSGTYQVFGADPDRIGLLANCSTVHVIYYMDQNPRETNKYRPEGGGICWSTPDCRSSYVKNFFKYYNQTSGLWPRYAPLPFVCTPLFRFINAHNRHGRCATPPPIAAVYFLYNCLPARLMIHRENQRKIPVWKNLANQKSSVP